MMHKVSSSGPDYAVCIKYEPVHFEFEDIQSSQIMAIMKVSIISSTMAGQVTIVPLTIMKM